MSKQVPSNFDEAQGSSVSGGRAHRAPGSHRTLGDYELGREIGRGGMGTVYEAWHPDRDQPVALKVLGHHISASTKSIVRFQREAEAASRLHHDHITSMIEQGEQDGTYYYSMQLVDGPSLYEIIAATRKKELADATTVDLAETVDLSPGDPNRSSAAETDVDDSHTIDPSARASGSATLLTAAGDETAYRDIARHIANVADALDYAHRHGVVHRDIKPHNLLLGSDGRLQITDFGLARVAEQPGVTMTGEMIGSPLYMSPEQIIEGPSKVDHRTDIYSLGATMYEWLSLKPPYPGETRERVISLIMNSEPLPLRAHNHAIPAALETVCMKAIERDRDRRYRSAADFRDDLRRFVDDRPIRARRAGYGERARRFVLKHQLGTLAGVAIIVAAALVGWNFAMREQVQTRNVEVQQAHAREQAAKQEAEAARSVLDSVAQHLPPEFGLALSALGVAVEGVQQIVESDANEEPKILRDPIGADPSNAGTPWGIARRVTYDLFDALAENPNATAADPVDDFSKLLAQAWNLKDHDAPTALQRVEAYLVVRPDDVVALQLRAWLCGRLGEWEKLSADAEHIIRLRKDSSAGHLFLVLGDILAHRFERALTRLDSVPLIADHPEWPGLIRALTLMGLRRFAEARSLVDAQLARDPTLAPAWLTQALLSNATAQLPKAIEDISRAIELEPNNADALAMRGLYYGLAADSESAARDFKHAIELAGSSASLSLHWMLAARLASQAAPSKSGDKTGSEPPAIPGNAAENISIDQVRDWFSRHVWPTLPDSD